MRTTLFVREHALDLTHVPVLQGEDGLCFTPLQQQDLPLYEALCRNESHNRFWGYTEQDPEKETDGFYFRDAEKDRLDGTSLCLALRLDDTFIGEGVIYRFSKQQDSAEMGLRLLPAFCGMGYGKQGFRLLARYALEVLGLSAVTARAHRENRASLYALSSFMQKTHEQDDHMFFLLKKE